MAKVTTYKNSKFASFLSILGYIAIVCGVYAAFNDLPVGGIITVAIGFVLKLLGGFIAKKKSEKEAKKKQNA